MWSAPARADAEVGGHGISGHVDCLGQVLAVRQPENNHVLRIGVPASHRRYVFAKGYIAINGASLTVAEVHRAEGWFEVWLIPETLRMTTFGEKGPGRRAEPGDRARHPGGGGHRARGAGRAAGPAAAGAGGAAGAAGRLAR